MQHYLLGPDRPGTGQRLRQGPDRVVPHGENDDARLGNPGGRLVLGTDGEVERLGDRLLAAAVQAHVVAPPPPPPPPSPRPLPCARQRQRQSDTGAAGPDDPHDVGRQSSSARTRASERRPGRGDPGATWRAAPTPALRAPGGPPPAGGALPPDARRHTARSRIPDPG